MSPRKQKAPKPEFSFDPKSGKIEEVLRITKSTMLEINKEIGELETLRAQNARMREMLVKVEHSGFDPHHGYVLCVWCDRVEHKSDCELALLLKEAGASE